MVGSTRRVQADSVIELRAWAACLVLTMPGCRDGDAVPSDEESSSGDDGGSDGEADSDDSTGDPSDDDEVAEYDLLTPAEHLARVSMALRGVRPSEEDLRRVEEDPEAIGELVDAYLESDSFGEVIRDLHNDALLLDAEIFELDPVGPLQDEASSLIAESVLQGPLRLIEHVVRTDAPYTEIVTADYWLVDERSSVVWGTDYEEGGEAWQAVDLPDDRATAGILTDNGFYMRHESCGFNFNRGRAQLVAKALLCHDFLAADIDVDGSVDLSDPEAVATAVDNVAACVACHQTLDPLASTMNGFFEAAFPDPPYAYPLPPMFIEEYEEVWPELTGRSPAFFGEPVADMTDLGQQIADDPRFSLCTAARFYGYFSQVAHQDVPLEVASELQLVLEDNDFSAKALVKHIMLSEDFRRAAVAEGSDAPAEDLVGYKRARPFQLANLVEDLTGYEWMLDMQMLSEDEPDVTFSLARSAFIGFEVLAGGHDSFFQTTATTTANATTVLFMQTLAARGASYVVDSDFAVAADDRRLLGLVDPDTADEAAVRAQLVALFRRFYAEAPEPDDAAIDDAYAIFQGVLERSDDVALAWKATLTAMLSDMDILYY